MSYITNMTHRFVEHMGKSRTISEMEIIVDGSIPVSVSTVFDVTTHPRYFETPDTENRTKWTYYIVVDGVIIHPFQGNNCSIIGFSTKQAASMHGIVWSIASKCSIMKFA